jgi:hypothetical protein
VFHLMRSCDVDDRSTGDEGAAGATANAKMDRRARPGDPCQTVRMEIATPIRIAPAYVDRDAIWGLVRSHGPYPLMWSSAGYGEMSAGFVDPWFRGHWALDGRAVDDATGALLHHAPFVEAARRLFDVEVVRPATLLVNLMGPMSVGARHVDIPTFRGLPREAVPVWLLVAMGASGLFERWAVRVAGALTWFYEHDDGEYEYWPEGTGARSECVRGPFGNEALVADNDRMPHRVGTIGDPATFASRVTVASESTLEADAKGGWTIASPRAAPQHLADDETRVSILWKALTFVDAADARRFDEHDDDLDVGTVVRILRTDLARRGHPVDEPADPLSDPAWARAVTATYITAL